MEFEDVVYWLCSKFLNMYLSAQDLEIHLLFILNKTLRKVLRSLLAISEHGSRKQQK